MAVSFPVESGVAPSVVPCSVTFAGGIMAVLREESVPEDTYFFAGTFSVKARKATMPSSRSSVAGNIKWRCEWLVVAVAFFVGEEFCMVSVPHFLAIVGVMPRARLLEVNRKGGTGEHRRARGIAPYSNFLKDGEGC